MRGPRLLFFAEVWVINQSEELAVWFFDRCHYDVIAGLGDRFVDGAATGYEMIDCHLHIVHAEVCPWAVCHVRIRVEAEFIATHVKSDIKRLVEIWLYAEHVRPPGFIRLQIARRIDKRAKTEEFHRVIIIHQHNVLLGLIFKTKGIIWLQKIN